MLILKKKMKGHVCTAFSLLSFVVLTASGAEVYLIDASANNGNVHRLTMTNNNQLVLDPVSSDETLKAAADKMYELYNSPDNNQVNELPNTQHRVFGDMFGRPQKLKSQPKKYRSPRRDIQNQMNSLEPIIRYILNQQKSNMNYNFHDFTKKEKPQTFAEDYIDFENFGRVQAVPDFSQDYIDFRFTRSGQDAVESSQDPTHRLRRATDIVKKALRSYADSDEDSDDEDDEDTKSKRFEVVKNKHNKKDIKSDSAETGSDEHKKAKKKKAIEGDKSLDSAQDFSQELSDEAKTKNSKAGKKNSGEENNGDEPVEMYLQGNKLTIYPPMQGDSVEGDSDEDTRRGLLRRMRLPYFLPKRNRWTPKDIPNLGYYFFNGPKGVSQETD